MTLTNRLSASFLGALAIVLVGFSTALYVVASVYLDRSIDERLTATLNTLAALAEDEPGGLDWEPDRKHVFADQDQGQDQVRWVVLDSEGSEVDRSKYQGKSAGLIEASSRWVDPRNHPWRVVERRVRSSHPRDSSTVGNRRHGMLVLRAGLRLDPTEKTLRTLALALVMISASLWGTTAVVGRWLCRRALAPLTRMASAARTLGTEEPGQRLPEVASSDELEDLALAFNGLLGRWQEALERQSRFAGDASHQLRTPLAALIGQVDVALRRDRPTEEYRQTLGRVRDQADRLRRITESLLYLARADTEAGMPALTVLDLASWVGEQIQRRHEDSGEAMMLYDLSTDPVAWVQAHPALLGEVLDNLLDNARDHGESGAPIAVKVSVDGSGVNLSVEDQGRGIAPSDLSRIFEPFYRASQARKTAPNGVGLGLAVARRIIVAMGGSLEAESQPGQGSRFVIRLPEAAPIPLSKVAVSIND